MSRFTGCIINIVCLSVGSEEKAEPATAASAETQTSQEDTTDQPMEDTGIDTHSHTHTHTHTHIHTHTHDFFCCIHSLVVQASHIHTFTYSHTVYVPIL